MKPTKITWSESKESVDTMGLKSWRKAGVEIELDGDDVEKCYDEAKIMVANAFGAPPYLWSVTTEPISNEITTGGLLPTIDTQKEKIEIAIDNCESLYELDLLQNDSIKHGLVPQYLEKKKSLK